MDLTGEYAENAFVAPTKHKLRGNYEDMRADFTVDQPYERYTEEEQERWRFLYARQRKLLDGYACREFIDSLDRLNADQAIPRLDETNEILNARTGWSLVAVPGLIPNDVFFNHLANRRFPVAWWIRKAEELDYLVEPDIFHDYFGHVPLLADPVFADYMELYGRQGGEAIPLGADHILARLYWYMVEFGLIQTKEGLRAFGAGMLSSKGETIYSVDSPEPNRIAFDLERVMTTGYMVDDFQRTYFVIDSFEQLFEATSRDLTAIYERLLEREKTEKPTDPARILSSDTVITRGLISDAA